MIPRATASVFGGAWRCRRADDDRGSALFLLCSICGFFPGNHKAVFETCGLDYGTYRYFDEATKGLDFVGMTEDLKVCVCVCVCVCVYVLVCGTRARYICLLKLVGDTSHSHTHTRRLGSSHVVGTLGNAQRHVDCPPRLRAQPDRR
jgi:hypothetical protein